MSIINNPMFLDEIESHIIQLREKERQICQQATSEIKGELDRLLEQKRKLTEEKFKSQLAMAESVMPIIGRCCALAVKITLLGKHTLWIDWSGHVKSFKVRGHEGAWYAHREETVSESFYLEADSAEDVQDTLERAEELERFLIKMLEEDSES